MEINKINNSPKFEARLVVKKDGFVNLGKDLVDTVEIGLRSSGTAASSVGETTALPSEISTGYGFSKIIRRGLGKISEKFSHIFHRNLKTSAIEDTQGIKYAMNTSSNASYGSELVTTGAGSYASSIASGLDQSINYPMYGSEIVPELIAKSNIPHVGEIAEKMQLIAYDTLDAGRFGLGNEHAFIPSSITSSSGATLSGGGFKRILTAGEVVENPRKIPS